MNEREEVLNEVARFLRGSCVRQPEGETEEHVNWVLEDLARRVERDRM